jgi:benzoyl-CoA reductase/2-hydroxyglutaryl-CoA dehydratase subunit BcrC/BadD/HgdB
MEQKEAKDLDLQGIKFNHEELVSLQEFLPHTPGAKLLQKVLEHVEARYQALALSRGATMEVVRAGQGAIEALNEFAEIMYQFTKADWNRLVDDEKRLQDEIKASEERVDVRY